MRDAIASGIPATLRALTVPRLAMIRRHGPEYSARRWFGPTDARQRKRLSRALGRLEDDGLLIRFRRRGKTISHIRLTTKGRVLASEYLTPE